MEAIQVLLRLEWSQVCHKDSQTAASEVKSLNIMDSPHYNQLEQMILAHLKKPADQPRDLGPIAAYRLPSFHTKRLLLTLMFEYAV